MAVTLAQIERATSIIERRIKRRIEAIRAEHSDKIKSAEAEAEEIAYTSLGIKEEKARIAERTEEIDGLRKQANDLEGENNVENEVIFNKLFPADTTSYGYHRNNKMVNKIQAAIKRELNNIFANDDDLSEIATLEEESERAEEALIVATSPKQLRAVLDAVNNILGESRGMLGETAHNTEAPEE